MSNRVTLKDVAKKADVSSATVSYVLNEKKSISAETKKRVWDAIESLDYVPDLSARSLTMRDSKLIGVVVPQTEPGSKLMFQNNFYSEILGSIEYHARLHGYHVIISATDANESYMTLAKERNLDGIIVIGMYPDEFYQQMKKTRIPIVLIDSYCDDHYYHNIRIDDAYGSYLATKYVLEQGHRKIAFFSGQLKENGVMKKRLIGYQQALAEKQVPFCPEYVFEGKIDYDSGIQLAENLLGAKLPATAVVAAADILAMGAMKGFYERGVKVPDDLSVMGFDDLEISKYLTPGLTTIKQEISQKGERAVEMLFKNIQEPNLTKQEQILPVSIVERSSVKSIKQKGE
ncbi:LacI family transcriptional regulator [Hydrogenoanaerobacterium saccharovorans]|uniref:Transcriptional regulator, LacI family n=1 Tax=Hydrogenoanaerobacterium saccharovorans TaxID=474960 RepID=A0A1H8BJF3_9FIRM|nr:LacI family DNA-binding transcriptional regulator [Hydrogenoanaerobacterium saccharovorans]RPF47378.1 LacI family transcriptional regulator [Hydrogenoanaerobacterium saccharovorans]SEM82896.1 transcriptional regulator, LacI family [Hydrogenoanaerobacterium saccharovorans]